VDEQQIHGVSSNIPVFSAIILEWPNHSDLNLRALYHVISRENLVGSGVTNYINIFLCKMSDPILFLFARNLIRIKMLGLTVFSRKEVIALHRNNFVFLTHH